MKVFNFISLFGFISLIRAQHISLHDKEILNVQSSTPFGNTNDKVTLLYYKSIEQGYLGAMMKFLHVQDIYNVHEEKIAQSIVIFLYEFNLTSAEEMMSQDPTIDRLVIKPINYDKSTMYASLLSNDGTNNVLIDEIDNDHDHGFRDGLDMAQTTLETLIVGNYYKNDHGRHFQVKGGLFEIPTDIDYDSESEIQYVPIEKISLGGKVPSFSGKKTKQADVFNKIAVNLGVQEYSPLVVVVGLIATVVAMLKMFEVFVYFLMETGRNNRIELEEKA